MISTFYLGTHMPSWLERVDFELFVSHRRLMNRKTLPKARTSWALDSGGFSELSMFGEWRTTPVEYVEATRRYDNEIGHLDWAAPMDWMCEPFMLAKTGLTVADHQARTVDNFLTVQDLWDGIECPFMPVLQGWTLADYHRCVDLYSAAGVDLMDYPVVGIGSVCRRQATDEIGRIVRSLSHLALHGFGVKLTGLQRYSNYLNSADSMAWSFRGRHVKGCSPSHQNEANCLRFAAAWREDALRAIGHDDDYDQLEFSLAGAL